MSGQSSSSFSAGFSGCLGVGCAIAFILIGLPIIAFAVLGVIGTFAH